MPPRRYRPAAPRHDEPGWLTQLREALFRDPALPAQDDAFPYDGSPHVCLRTLNEADTRVQFHEVVLHPVTHQVRQHWTVEIEAGAFVGTLPPGVFTQQVDLLRIWLLASRPRSAPRERRPAFNPGRFAQHPPLTRR